jgi:hypothetical protein
MGPCIKQKEVWAGKAVNYDNRNFTSFRNLLLTIRRILEPPSTCSVTDLDGDFTSQRFAWSDLDLLLPWSPFLILYSKKTAHGSQPW